MADRPGGRERRWLRLAGLIVAAGLVVWALRDLNGRAFVSALAEARYPLVALAAVVNLLALGIQARRWQRLLEPVGRVRYATALGAMLVGFTLSSVLPARAGEVARVQLVAQRMNVSRAAVAGATVLDHVVNGVTLLPLALLVPLSRGVPAWMRTGLLFVMTLTLLSGVLAWWAAAPQGDGVQHSGLMTLVRDVRAGFVASRSPAVVLRACGLGLLAWMLEAWTVWLTLSAFGLQLGPAAPVIVLIAVNVAVAIPSTPANLGTFEVAAMLALTALNVPKEEAVAFALGYHALQLLPVWLAGIVAWIRMRRRGGDVLGQDSSSAERSASARSM